MAMLGKRFQRTTSMSQIGPGSNSHAEKAQVQKYYQQQLPEGEVGRELHQPANQWEILKNAEVMMMMMMQATSGSNTSSDEGAREASVRAAAGAAGNENEQHHHHHPQIGPYPWSPAPNTVCSPPERHTMSSPSTLITIPAHHFLDACFYCKRRLHPEKDIFIYRGDAAFCTEECRYRQILKDETHSQASKKGGSNSETAVAA